MERGQALKHENGLGENGNRHITLPHHHDHGLLLDHEIASMPHHHVNGDVTEFDDTNNHESGYNNCDDDIDDDMDHHGDFKFEYGVGITVSSYNAYG
ncbi:hypothetical protein L1987_50536 [Smallanthus sonchifolius]|uniref:Uncharacterized protein n=1 Tax=Smallanthus sonchifolius TaxID=185202 RepID=A0ACB9ENC3_9ASTR|nr:hypothetical protein L1987_50536 [Smallanthus sonchifolius]